jgi:hypothetical protein
MLMTMTSVTGRLKIPELEQMGQVAGQGQAAAPSQEDLCLGQPSADL